MFFLFFFFFSFFFTYPALNIELKRNKESMKDGIRNEKRKKLKTLKSKIDIQINK